MRLLLILCLAWAAPAYASSAVQELLPFPGASKKIEYFWQAPEGKGPWPVMVFLHPNQEGKEKIGGKMFLESGALESWSKKGWLAVAISQQGFGGSTGKSDFCGPETQTAVHLVLDQIRQRAGVKKNSIFLYGGSRGAVVAALVAGQDDQLAGVILKSGLYDFESWFSQTSWLNPVKLQYVWETGWPSTAGLRERSAIQGADKIKAPLLILHGSKDDRAPMAYALAFAERVQSNGGSAELRTFDAAHILPQEKVSIAVEEFLKRNRR